MSDSVLKQAALHIKALRRGGDNPNVSEILRVAGVAGASRREEEQTEDQFPLAGLAMAGEAGELGELGSAITGMVAQKEIEREEEGEEDSDTPGEEEDPLEGIAQAAGGEEVEELGEQLMSPPRELQEVSDDVPERQRRQSYPGEDDPTIVPRVRNITRDEDYGERMKALFHPHETPRRFDPYTIHGSEDEDLSHSAAGGRLTSTPEVDFGESGVESIVEYSEEHFPTGRIRQTDRGGRLER